MKTNQKWNFAMIVGAVCVSSCLSASGALIYDNSVNDLSYQFSPGTTQVGDEIIFGGTERLLQSFSFEYWVVGTVNVEVQLRLNDGAPFNGYNTPGTVLYDSGLVTGLGTTTRSTLNFSSADLSGGLFLPADHLTLVVQFSGLDQSESAGVDLYSPPVVGQNTPDYWENTPSGWELKQIVGGPPVDFAARFDATAVPEPTSFVSGALCASLLGVSMLLKRKGAIATTNS